MGELVERADAPMPYKEFSELEIHNLEVVLREVWKVFLKDRAWVAGEAQSCEEKDFSGKILLAIDEFIQHQAPSVEVLATIFDPLPEMDTWRTTYRDYKGAKLDHRPDYAFRRKHYEPGTSRLNNCLFIEAKVVEDSKKMDLYCGNGLKRFVIGEYAWAMPQAMMLAYVRNTSQTLPKSLETHLSRNKKPEEYLLHDGPAPCASSRVRNQPRLHYTVHGRDWLYPKSQTPPGDIKVYHLWLHVA